LEKFKNLNLIGQSVKFFNGRLNKEKVRRLQPIAKVTRQTDNNYDFIQDTAPIIEDAMYINFFELRRIYCISMSSCRPL